jgi:hypothetical protein
MVQQHWLSWLAAPTCLWVTCSEIGGLARGGAAVSKSSATGSSQGFFDLLDLWGRPSSCCANGGETQNSQHGSPPQAKQRYHLYQECCHYQTRSSFSYQWSLKQYVIPHSLHHCSELEQSPLSAALKAFQSNSSLSSRPNHTESCPGESSRSSSAERSSGRDGLGRRDVCISYHSRRLIEATPGL